MVQNADQVPVELIDYRFHFGQALVDLTQEKESRIAMNQVRLLVVLFMVFTPHLVFAQSTKVPPVIKLTQVKAKRDVLDSASRDKPLILLNADAARKYFDRDAMKLVDQKVDFDQQVLMVFAWRGSGQDELRPTVLESFPEQLRFQYIGGRTRDLREESRQSHRVNSDGRFDRRESQSPEPVGIPRSNRDDW